MKRRGSWALLCMIGWGIAAHAAPPRVVVVGAHPMVEGEPVTALWGARTLVEQRSDLTLVDLAERLGGGRPRDTGAMQALLTRGADAYASADVPEAEKALSIAALIGSGHPATRPLAVEALSTLARLRAAQQDEAGAVRAFVRLLRLQPDFALDPSQAAPSATRRLDKARAIIDEAAPSRLRVTADPVAAAVFVDGRLAGVTPLYLPTLPAGTHHLRISADGYRDDFGLVDLEAGRETAVQAALLPADDKGRFDAVVEALPDDPSAAPAGLDALRDLSAAEQAAVIAVVDGWLVGAVFTLRSGQRVSAGRVPLGGDGRAAGEALMRLLYRGDTAALAGTPPPVEAVEEGGSRWWLWTSIAVGVAVAVAVPVTLWALGDDEGIERRAGTGAVIIRF